jgi:hypothetical protein
VKTANTGETSWITKDSCGQAAGSVANPLRIETTRATMRSRQAIVVRPARRSRRTRTGGEQSQPSRNADGTSTPHWAERSARVSATPNLATKTPRLTPRGLPTFRRTRVPPRERLDGGGGRRIAAKCGGQLHFLVDNRRGILRGGPGARMLRARRRPPSQAGERREARGASLNEVRRRNGRADRRGRAQIEFSC